MGTFHLAAQLSYACHVVAGLGPMPLVALLLHTQLVHHWHTVGR